MSRRIRVVIAKPGLDGHDGGRRSSPARCATRAWKWSTPGCVRRRSRSSAAALQEDADVIGLSILSGAHKPHLSAHHGAAAREGLDDVLVVVGGIVPDTDLPFLRSSASAASSRPAPGCRIALSSRPTCAAAGDVSNVAQARRIVRRRLLRAHPAARTVFARRLDRRGISRADSTSC